MNMELFYRNLQEIERLTEMRRIQDEQRNLFPEFTAAAAGEESDTGTSGKQPWSQCAERITVGVRSFPNLKIPPQNPRLHYFQTKQFWR